MRAFRAGLFVVASLAVACGPKTIPLPVVTTPKFPEFVEPTTPPALSASPAAVSGQDRGWRFLQAGELKNAEYEFQLALRSVPGFYPAETALGYLELARKDAKAALPHFERALDQDSRYLPALIGRGQAALAASLDAEALYSFEAALAVDPSLTDIRRRVEVLKFRGLEQDLASARAAAKAGRLDDAAREYGTAISSSPESAFLYRELGVVERQRRQGDAAIADFRKALELDPTDAASLANIGDILDDRGDLDGAAKAYSDALALEPSDQVEGKLDAVRARLELARLPEEYRAIDEAPQVTRGDLAALIGVRLAPIVQASRRREAVVVTDVRTHWAATWIMAVARAGILEAYPNHTFQPGTIVRRADLAQVVSHLLMLVRPANPAQAASWQSARLKFADLPPGHLAYPAASMAVAAGVMKVDADNNFQPSRPVTGAEAIEAIERIAGLEARSTPTSPARR